MDMSAFKDALFLVWGPPSHGPRSQVFARELGIKELHFVYSTTQRGLLSALVKYPPQALKTLLLLFSKKPKLVIVQSPPSLAVLFVYFYCAMTGSQYIVDAHSAAFSRRWIRPLWLTKHLARKAMTTIVTNGHFQQMIQSWGAHSFVLHDIPTVFSRSSAAYPLDGEFNMVVITTFAPDEPLDEILSAAAQIPDVHFYVTGRKKNAPAGAMERAAPNVHFTDFLPNDTYYSLLGSVQAVMCLTTRDHTMQRGACEALWMGKPIVTSDWGLLREYFRDGTIHVKNSSDAIVIGVREMKNNLRMYEEGIVTLQSDRRHEWQEKISALLKLIEH
jgi:glycosyltransferase involved in cell wall biosynthesis